MPACLRVCCISGFAAAAVVCGCAARTPQGVTAAPSGEELPEFPQLKDTIAASIGVEDHRPPARMVLVPKFEEPRFTPEEEKVLGIREERYDFLEFFRPNDWNNLRWYPRPAGDAVGVGFDSPATFGYSPWSSPIGLGRAGGMATGGLAPHSSRWGLGLLAIEPAGVGRDVVVDVGINPASKPVSNYRLRHP